MQKAEQLLDFYLLIPCYNNWEGLISSLKSIRYDPEKFAVLIVDDGSPVTMSREALIRLAGNGLTIHMLRLPANRGITVALNSGLKWLARQRNFRYVARLDSGDICDSTRFYDQVEYLEQYPEVDLLGSWCLFKDFKTGTGYRYEPPGTHENITKQMYFRNTFIPSTVMWRASGKNSALTFPDQFPHAEDYAFFYEIINNGKGAIIPKKLVTCEINYGSISLQHRKEQLKSRIKVVKHYAPNKVMVAAGITWVRLLMAIPYSLMIKVKQSLFRQKA